MFHYDANPYAVLYKGRAVWVLDGYTTSNRYPYAQTAITEQPDIRQWTWRARYNYVRNPVKVVVEAYSGDIKIFLYEPNSPTPKLQKTRDLQRSDYAGYRMQPFPGLLRSEQELDRTYPGLCAITSVTPKICFQVQSQMIGRYQVKGSGHLLSRVQPDGKSLGPQTTNWRPTTDKSPDAGNRLVVPATVLATLLCVPTICFAALPGSTKQEFYLQSNLRALFR